MTIIKSIKNWWNAQPEREIIPDPTQEEKAKANDLAAKVANKLSVLSGKTITVNINKIDTPDSLISKLYDFIQICIGEDLYYTKLTVEGFAPRLDRYTIEPIKKYLEKFPKTVSFPYSFNIKIGEVSTRGIVYNYLCAGAIMHNRYINIDLNIDLHKSFDPPYMDDIEIKIQE